MSIVIEEGEVENNLKDNRNNNLNKAKALPATAKADSMRKNKIDLTLDDEEENYGEAFRKTPKTSSSSTISNN